MTISWDKYNKHSALSLSQDELSVYNSDNTSVFKGVTATIGKTEGKWYWEVVQNSGTRVDATMIGVATKTASLGGSTSASYTNNHRLYSGGGYKFANRLQYGTTYTYGDIISVLLDMDNGTIEFWKNGVSQGIAFGDILTLGEVYPHVAFYGQGNITANFGIKPFIYSMPNEYKPYEIISKTLISLNNEYKTYNSGWQTVSSSTPLESQFLSDGIDDLSALERKVQSVTPIKMNKSEILLNNEVGQVFSKTLNLKAYMDIRKITPSSTNGKMVVKNTTDNKYYIESNGGMVEITDTSLANIISEGNSTITIPIDFYDTFGEEVEVLFYTSDTSLTDLDLTLEANWSPIDELEGNFEIVTWTDETDSTRTLEMSAIPKPQFIRKSTVSDIGGSLNGIIANTTSSNVRFLLTNNNSTWYKWNGTTFENVTYSKVDDILTLGNTYDELANVDYSKWTHSKINIGVFLKDDDNTTSKVNELGIIANSPIRTSQVSDLNFYILNTTAKIELDLKGLWLSGQLSDLDLTRVQYRVFLNEQPYYPLSGQFTNLDNPPLNIDITFKSEEVKINDWNTLRVEFKDSFGTVDYWQTTFVGNYSSLMFADTDGNYYSDDVGKVLQYLDFGVFFGGQYTLEHEVVVKNQYGYDVNNLTIEANTGHLPEGVAVQFSDTNDPFTPQSSLFLPNELKNDEEVSFYIRMISDIDSVPNGENKFNIFVKAERKV